MSTPKKPAKKAPPATPPRAPDAPHPALERRPRRRHRLVDPKGRELTVYDAVSVAQHFARPPRGIDAEVARSVYVYEYGGRHALHRYVVDEALLATTATRHRPTASTEVMNQHLLGEDNFRPCQALSSDGRELYFLRYGPTMQSVELLALDPLTLAPLREPVRVGPFNQYGSDGNPMLPGGPGRVVARIEIENRKGDLHLLDVKTGAVIASAKAGRRMRAWHVAGRRSPFLVDVDGRGVRVRSVADGAFEEIARINSRVPIEMIDVGPADERGAFTVLALSGSGTEPALVIRRYVVRPTAAEGARTALVGEYFADDVMFATHVPHSVSLACDGRVLAVVGGSFATNGLWEWFAPGAAREEHIVETACGEDGRVFRVVSGHGAALFETGEIVPAPKGTR